MPKLKSQTGDELDTIWMRLAIDEGKKGLGGTSPNPPVGAVLVKDGRFLSKGHHQKAGGPHAEVAAIQAADPADVVGSTLFVTLEPCSTKGKTGACLDAIRKAGITRVVVGSTDPNPAHAGKGLEKLKRSRKISFRSGVLEDECNQLIRFFSKHITTGRPYVIAKTGMTLDGRITPPNGGSPWITSETARADVQLLRSQVDAILVGGETVRKDNPKLTVRTKLPKGREQPLRIIVTKSGRIPKKSKVLTDKFKDRTRVFHVEQLDTVFQELGDSGVTSVLLECGGRLMAHAFEEKLVDEVTFYVAPLIGGGGRRAVEGKGFRCALIDPQITQVGPDLRITAPVRFEDH